MKRPTAQHGGARKEHEVQNVTKTSNRSGVYIYNYYVFNCSCFVDVEMAVEAFDRLQHVDPYRLDNMDTYSNLLYVKVSYELTSLINAYVEVFFIWVVCNGVSLLFCVIYFYVMASC